MVEDESIAGTIDRYDIWSQNTIYFLIFIIIVIILSYELYVIYVLFKV